jgi:hypothetical protein
VTKRMLLLSAGLAVALVLTSLTPRASAQEAMAPAVAPPAPTGLTALVDRDRVSLFWTHTTGPFTHYILEAGLNDGGTIATFPTSAFANPSLLTERISALRFTGIGAGDYFVRVRAANGAEVGPATPDILVRVTGGCVPPSAPIDFTAISRTIPGQTFGWMQWNAGTGGVPTSWVLLASEIPGGIPVASIPLGTPFLNLDQVPPGIFFLRVVAQNACGQSAPSAETAIASPSSNLPARTPDPVNGGRLPMPMVQSIVELVVNGNPGLLSLQQSCPGFSSDPSRLVKYERNAAIDAIVDILRLIDTRFGYNSKPTRGPADNGGQPVEIAGDEIAYHYGADAPEGSPNVHLVDLLLGHCGSGTRLTWRPFTNGEFGRWTGAGRF